MSASRRSKLFVINKNAKAEDRGTWIPFKICHKSRSIGKTPKDLKNSDFLSILYNNSFMKSTKPKIIIGDRVRISKSDITFRKEYTPEKKVYREERRLPWDIRSGSVLPRATRSER